MPTIRGFQSSFNGGVVTPEFWGRIDDAKYQTGMAVCDNFIVLPHGPVVNCPGTQFVAATKSPARKSRLIPFTYSTTQTVVIELGHQYIRLYSGGQALLTPGGSAAYAAGTTYNQGDLVTSGGVTYYSMQGTNTGHTPASSPTWWYALGTTYEIPSPYVEADLFAITFVQSNDILTLCHPNYAPAQLARYGATNWQLANISFGNALSPPASLSISTVRGSPASSATKTYQYNVTSTSLDGKSESALVINAGSTSQNLLDSGAHNDLTWPSVSGVTRFNVYRFSGGLFGLMGVSTTLSFTDDGSIIPDTGNTPPTAQYPFATDFPAAVSYYQQRRLFAGTTLFPQKTWGTRTGTESDLAYSIPVKDTDAISFTVASRDVNTIRHIVPLSDIILLTAGGVWRVSSTDGGALTPSTISVKPQSGVGANTAQPIIDDSSTLYIAARGGHIRELSFSWQVQSYVSSDLSLRAPNLFDGYDITQLAFQRSPNPIMWAISTAGNIIGMTYVPEQDVRALWTRSTTNGTFESVCCITEGVEDRIYVVVNRTIGGTTVRYVERFAARLWSNVVNTCYVDCAGVYSGSPTTTVSGLTWLEGQKVNILADGAVMPQAVVTGGAVTLTEAASNIQVGLPLVSQVQTLPAAFMQAPGAGQGRPKNLNRAFFRVTGTGGLSAGYDPSDLVQAKVRTTESPGSPPNLVTDEIEIVPYPSWSSSGQFYIYHTDPLPMTLLSMTPEFSVGS